MLGLQQRMMIRTSYLQIVLILLIITGTACQSVKYTDRGALGGSFSSLPHKATNKHKVVSTSPLKISKVETAEEICSLSLKDKHFNSTTSHKGNADGLKNVNQKLTSNFLTKKSIKKIKQNQRANAVQAFNKDNPEEGSIRWFVYLLLCFLLPPLAYYLIKRQTDTMFWVCLLCFLLTSTFIGGFRYGLLGLISIVIALLTLFKIDI